MFGMSKGLHTDALETAHKKLDTAYRAVRIAWHEMHKKEKFGRWFYNIANDLQRIMDELYIINYKIVHKDEDDYKIGHGGWFTDG